MTPNSFIFKPQSTKPQSSTNANSSVVALASIRNHFNLSTWLAIGACIQLVLSLLPIRKTYAVIPVALFLTWRLVDHALMSFGFTRNIYMDGVVVGKATALMPPAEGRAGQAGEGDICVVILSARSNDVNGIFGPKFKLIADFFQSMNASLDAEKPTNGFLGSTAWINACDRTTSSEIMNVYYFRSRADVHNFANAPAHRAGWNWWIELTRNKEDLHVGIAHEVYDVPAGKWENVYANMRPTGFGATAHLISGADGVQKWANPLVDANRGNLRTSRGRSGILDDDFTDEKYDIAYQAAEVYGN